MCFLCVSAGSSSQQHIAYEALPTQVRVSAFTTGADYVESLLKGYSWTGTINRGAVVDFTFDRSDFGADPSALITKRITLDVMQQFSNVANISFSQNDSSSELTIGTADLPEDNTSETLGIAYFFASATQLARIEVQIDKDYASQKILSGTLGYQTLLHELGHAVGLKHPFDADSGTGTVLDTTLDNWNYTVMSYTAGANVNNTNYASSLMLFDIAAVQYLYGANTSYHAGNDNYIINGEKKAYTIWDGGGNDTITSGVGNQNVLIDLTDTYRFDSDLLGSGRSPGLNKIGQSTFWTAFGSNIESAVAGSGNDTVDGNDNNNTLVGQLGKDILDGWEGNDTIFGGRGVADGQDVGDIIRGDLGSDLIYGNGGNDTLFGGGGLYNATGFDDINDTVRAGTKETSFTIDFALNQFYQDDTDGADRIYGGYGSDIIYGNGGDDSLYGGGASADPLDQADLIYGGRGSDQIFGNGGNDLIFGGGAVVDNLDSVDTIYGGLGNDTIYGNGGDDIIYGGPGNDSLIGDSGFDLYVIQSGSGIDYISAFENPGNIDGDRFFIEANINNTGVDTIAEILSRINYTGTRAEVDLGLGNKLVIFGIANGALTGDDFLIFS